MLVGKPYFERVHTISLDGLHCTYPKNTSCTPSRKPGRLEFILRMEKEYKEKHSDAQVIELQQRAKNTGLQAARDEPPSSSIHFALTAMVGLESQPSMPSVDSGEPPLNPKS